MSYDELNAALHREVRANVSDPAAVARLFELMSMLQRGFERVVDDSNGLRDQVERQLIALKEKSIANDGVFNDVLLEAALRQEADFMHYNERERQQAAELRAQNALYNPFHYDMNKHLGEVSAEQAKIEAAAKTPRTIAEIEKLT